MEKLIRQALAAFDSMSQREPCDCGCPSKSQAVLMKPAHCYAIARDAAADIRAAIADAQPTDDQRLIAALRAENERLLTDVRKHCDLIDAFIEEHSQVLRELIVKQTEVINRFGVTPGVDWSAA